MCVFGTQLQEACHTDVRVVVAGSVDSGKSTLVAVLTQVEERWEGSGSTMAH